MGFYTKDSGKRRSFGTGAVRDMDTGKPRFSDVPTERIIELTGNKLTPIENNPVNLTPQAKDSYDLIPNEFLDHLQALLERGAEKYSAHNWRKGIPVSEYYNSLMRHLHQWRLGDTSEHHLSAVAFNVMGIMMTEIDVQNGVLPEKLADMGVLCLLLQKNMG